MVIAVVRPTPPGHCGRFRGIAANRLSCFVAGRQVTMVLPRPWRLLRSLKLSISTSPAWILPAETGATTTAYGF